MADTSYYNLMMDALRDRLTSQLIDGIPDSEITQAGLIQVGRLQDDPTDTIINLLVRVGKVDSDPHVLNTNNDGPDASAPTYQIGGISAWYRTRFEIEFRLFFDGDYDRDASRTKAHIVLSRAKKALMTIDLRAVPRDSFGEKPHMISVYEYKITEGGGEGTFIWRGDMKLEVICDQEFE